MTEPDESSAGLPAALHAKPPARADALPAIVTAAGRAAWIAWDEFFQGEIANAHTRKNYTHAVGKFLVWAEQQKLELLDITAEADRTRDGPRQPSANQQ